jgi:hypothetical protein
VAATTATATHDVMAATTATATHDVVAATTAIATRDVVAATGMARSPAGPRGHPAAATDGEAHAQRAPGALFLSRPGALWASGFAAGSRGFTRQA